MAEFMEQIKLLPTFSGSNDSMPIKEYFINIDILSDHFEWGNNSKFFAAKLRLTGEARSFISEFQFTIKDFDSLKQALLERYDPWKNRRNSPVDFFRFWQPPDMPVLEYISKASAWSYEIFCKGERNMDHEEALRVEMLKIMLLGNLTPEIRRGVIAADPQTVEEIKEAAILQERAWKFTHHSKNCVSDGTCDNEIFAIQHAAQKPIKGCQDTFQKLGERVENLNSEIDALDRQQNRRRRIKTPPELYKETNPSLKFDSTIVASFEIVPTPNSSFAKSCENDHQQSVRPFAKMVEPAVNQDDFRTNTEIKNSVNTNTAFDGGSGALRECEVLEKCKTERKNVVKSELDAVDENGSTGDKTETLKRRSEEQRPSVPKKRTIQKGTKYVKDQRRKNARDLIVVNNCVRKGDSKAKRDSSRRDNRRKRNGHNRLISLISKKFHKAVPKHFREKRTEYLSKPCQPLGIFLSDQSGHSHIKLRNSRYSFNKRKRKKFVNV